MNNLSTRTAAILVFILVLTLFCFLITMNISSGYVQNSFYWGILIGILPGTASWLYLYSTWDPVNLQPKNENIKTLDPKWIPLVVVLGLVFSRITEYLFPAVINQLINGFLVSWIFMGVGYMIIQAWKHRPNQ